MRRFLFTVRRAGKTCKTGLAILAVGLPMALAALTYTSPQVVAILFVVGLLFRQNRAHLRILLPVVCLAFVLRYVLITEPELDRLVLPTSAGQYSARSSDILGLVSVRVVVRTGSAGNVLVFVETHSVPFSGLDADTLERERHRVLEAQGLPAAPDPESDRMTSLLFYSALANAMRPSASPEPVECPKGISAPETFWQMYPASFAHDCDVRDTADGRYWGRSTAEIPVTARLDVKSGRIENIVFQGPLSPYGQRAAATMKARMIGGSSVGVDAVSGATQTAYAVRSAANVACINANTASQEVPQATTH